MAKKVIPVISIIFVSVVAAFFFFEVNSSSTDNFSEIFELRAIFSESEETVVISFSDKSQKTNQVTLEILGMEESFQKTFERK